MAAPAKSVLVDVVFAQVAVAAPNALMDSFSTLLPFAIPAPLLFWVVQAVHLQVYATHALLAFTSKEEGVFLAYLACQAALTAPIVLIVASVNRDFTSVRQTDALPVARIRQDAPSAHLGVSVITASGDSSSTTMPVISVRIPIAFSATQLPV